MVASPNATAIAARFASPSPETRERIARTSASALATTFRDLGLGSEDVAALEEHWPTLCADPWWTSWLAAMVDDVARVRGDIDAPIPIFGDLLEDGESGRYLFLYLFALEAERTRSFLLANGFSDAVIARTFEVVVRHRETFRRKWGTLGFDAGWWVLPILRGELVQIGSLQFHRVTLAVGNLSPELWFNAAAAEALGVGFRQGDDMVGLHIPQDTNLTPHALDATFAEARQVLATCWPVHQRRLATCQTWMLDDRLADYLNPASNILAFQRRFQMLPSWQGDRENVLDFVFRQPGVALKDLSPSSSLQRAVLDVLANGDDWHERAGWFDFDGA